MAIPDSTVIFFIISLVLSLMAINSIVLYVKYPADICFYDFFATSILLAYALSTLVTQVNIYWMKSTDVAYYFNISQHALSIALAGVAFASAVLVSISRFYPAKIQLPSFDQHQLKEGLLVIAIVTFSGLYCIFTGLMPFQGLRIMDDAQVTLSPFASMVNFALPPAGAVAIFMASGKYDVSRFNRWLLYALAIIIWAIIFTQARRFLVYLALLYVIFYAFDASGYFNWRKKMMFLVVVVFLAYLGVKLFFAFRVAGWEYTGIKDPVKLIEIGFHILSNPSKYDYDYLLSQNSLERPFIIKYFAQVIEKVTFDRWLSGEAIYATLLLSIPSAFIGIKRFVIDEELIHPKIGLPVNDDANTILTTGTADFGWIGLLFYPVIVLLVLLFTISIVKKSGIKWMEYFVQFGALFWLLNVENSMAQYWSFIRGIFIILLMAFVFRFVMDSFFTRKINLIYR